MGRQREVKPCSVSDGDCLAPAGWRAGGLGGGVAYGDKSARSECYSCGEPVCSKCSTRKNRIRICNNCMESLSAKEPNDE